MDRWFPLTTERLRLREFQATDEAEIHAYASDPEVVRYASWGPNTPADTRVVLDAWLLEQRHWPRSTRVGRRRCLSRATAGSSA